MESATSHGTKALDAARVESESGARAPDAAASAGWTRRAVRRNMLVMSCCFALGEAALVSVIVLSGAALAGDPHVAALSNSVLYLGFVVFSLGAPALHEWLGSDRRAFVLGLAAINLYALSKMTTSDELQIMGAVASGFGGAMLWIAEGAFLTKLALIDAGCEPQLSPAASASQLSGIFATILPISLTMCKLLASAVLIPYGHRPDAIRYLLGLYALVGMLAALCMHVFVREPLAPKPVASAEVPQGTRRGGVCAQTGRRSLATLERNLSLDMALLAPNNVAFGLATGLVPSHGARIVVQALGAGHVGWLFALSGLLAATTAAALSPLSSWRGRAFATSTGALAFAATGLLCAWLGPEVKAAEPDRSFLAPIVILFLCYGYGVAVWQGTTMSVFAQHFADDPLLGFANLKIHSGLGSAFAFYAFNKLGAVVAGYMSASVALFGGVCFLALLPTLNHSAVPIFTTTRVHGVHAMSAMADAIPDCESTPAAPAAAPPAAFIELGLREHPGRVQGQRVLSDNGTAGAPPSPQTSWITRVRGSGKYGNQIL